jgi:hypothetical protein
MRLLSRLEYERLCGASWSTYFVRIPKVESIINKVLEQLNARKLTMPNGSGKILYFRLIQQENILFCIEQDS